MTPWQPYLLDKTKGTAAILMDQNNPQGLEFVFWCKQPLLFHGLVSENHFIIQRMNLYHVLH